MKKLWMRAGVSLMLTDEELNEILGDCEGSKGEEAIVTVLREGRFAFDGDSYIPQVTVEEFTERYGLPYETQEPEFCLPLLEGFRLIEELPNQGNPPCLKVLNDISRLLQDNGHEAASKFLDCSFEL